MYSFADVIFISHFCLITPVGPRNQFPSTFTHFLPPSSIFIHFIHFCLISPAGWGKERGGGSAVMLNPSWTHAISFCVAHSGVCFQKFIQKVEIGFIQFDKIFIQEENKGIGQGPVGPTQSGSVWLIAESVLPHFCHCFFSPATQRPNHRDQHHERERAIYFRVCPGKVQMDTCPNLLLFYHPKKLAEPACHLISPFS